MGCYPEFFKILEGCVFRSPGLSPCTAFVVGAGSVKPRHSSRLSQVLGLPVWPLPGLGNLELEYQADLCHLAMVIGPPVRWVLGPSALSVGYGRVWIAWSGSLVHNAWYVLDPWAPGAGFPVYSMSPSLMLCPSCMVGTMSVSLVGNSASGSGSSGRVLGLACIVGTGSMSERSGWRS